MGCVNLDWDRCVARGHAQHESEQRVLDKACKACKTASSELVHSSLKMAMLVEPRRGHNG